MVTADGAPVAGSFGGARPTGGVLDFPTLLLEVLGFSSKEYVSICHKILDGPFCTSVCAPTQALEVVKSLPEHADVYFGINPVKGPVRRNGGRGRAEDVTRLAVLPADLDVKSGACPDLGIADLIIDDLSAVLGTRPSAITHSGGGLHPYWVVSDGTVGGNMNLAALLKRWGRLVKAIADRHGAKADSVFDLSRVLRVPETYNCKAVANGQDPIAVLCLADTGKHLTVAEVNKILSRNGIPVEPGDGDGADDQSGRTGGNGRSAPTSRNEDWEFVDETCPYVRKWLDSIADDLPKGGRHQWAASQAVRLACAWMLGCIAESDFVRSQQLIADRLVELRAQTGEAAPPYEVPSLIHFGIERAATKTVTQAREELGQHKHLWAAPDHPYLCAKRVVDEMKCDGRPLRYWSGTWFEWTGSCYRGTSVEELRDYLYELLADAEYLNGKGEKLRWKPTMKKLNDLIDAIRGLVTLPAGIGASEWIDGHDEPVIACVNGLIRLEDRVLIPHTPEYFNIFAVPFRYEPDAPKPARWMKFLAEVFPNDNESAETLQEWFGYVVSGRTELQRMLMVIGPTRSGKGTVDKVLSALIGPGNHIGLCSNDLRNTFGLQPLLGKSLAVFSDERLSVDSKGFVETLLRIVGEDEVTVHIKNRSAWIGHLPTRLMFMSNEPPSLPDSSRAIVARMVPLHMPESFLGREDVGLAKALEEELPGILNCALDGLDRLTARGRFRIPTSGQAIVSLLGESASPVMQFVEAMCILGDKESVEVSKDALYSEFRDWCTANGHRSGDNGSLGRQLFAAYSTKIDSVKRGPKGGQRPYYVGITLRSSKGINSVRIPSA